MMRFLDKKIGHEIIPTVIHLKPMSRLEGPLKNHKWEEHWPKYEENLEKANGVLGWSLDCVGKELEDQEYHIKY